MTPTALKVLSHHATAALFAVSVSLVGATQTLAQTKPTISVPEFKNESTWWWWRGGTSRELADALSNELSSTGSFTVVERQKLDTVRDEQVLNNEGLVRQGTGAKTGQLTGAQYIVMGKVTSYEEGVNGEESKNRTCVLGICRGGAKQKQQAYVAIDLRVVNSTTGEVAYARTVEGLATSESESKSGGITIGPITTGGSSSKTTKAPVGKALRSALVEATNYLDCVMVKKGSCIAEFERKEAVRRENTGGVLDLQ